MDAFQKQMMKKMLEQEAEICRTQILLFTALEPLYDPPKKLNKMDASDAHGRRKTKAMAELCAMAQKLQFYHNRIDAANRLEFLEEQLEKEFSRDSS
jgi:hypothetical protein